MELRQPEFMQGRRTGARIAGKLTDFPPFYRLPDLFAPVPFLDGGFLVRSQSANELSLVYT